MPLIFGLGKLFGLGERGSKILALVLAVGALMALVWWAMDTMTDAAYAKGRADEKSVWVKAEDEFKKRAESAATTADANQAKRDAAHAVEVSKEREKIDEAIADGISPFDVMFPSSVR